MAPLRGCGLFQAGNGNEIRETLLIKVFSEILMSLNSLFLLTSVFMLILSTVPGFQNATRDMFGEDTDTEGEEENLFLKITEAIFVGWFTLEYLIRFVVSPHKVSGRLH